MNTSTSLAAVIVRTLILFLLSFGERVSAEGPNTIEAVSAYTKSGMEVIRVELSQSLVKSPISFAISAPAYVVFDFPGVVNGMGRTPIDVSAGNVYSVSVVQDAVRTRVVLKMRQATTYRTALEGTSFLVLLAPVLGNSVPSQDNDATAATSTYKHSSRVVSDKPKTRSALALPYDSSQDTARDGLITLNFTNADIEAVVRTMAVVTGRDIVVDPRVRGVLNLITDRAIAPAAAFNQFASALRLQGFVVLEADGLYKVVPESEARLQSGPVSSSISGIFSPASNQIVTQIFRLDYAAAGDLLSVLRPLITPNNTINVSPGNNSLVITDYADNMRRLARVISTLDVPNASDIETIQLKHSIAAELQPLILRLVDGSNAISSVSSDGSFRTTLLIDARSNSLILRAANPARSALVHTLVEKLDRPATENGNGAAGNIYVVYLKNAEAVRLATTLRAAMAANQASGTQQGAAGGVAQNVTAAAIQGGTAGSAAANTPLNNANAPSTGGQIQADPSTNSLIITAPEPLYRQMRAVIERLDGRRAQVMIETLIVEVNATKAASFGVQWQSALGHNTLIANQSTLSGPSILALTQAIATKNPANIQVASGLNLGIAGKFGSQYILGAIANFFSNDNDANVLSTPNLLTLDNEEARIVVGQNVPFPTGSYASASGASGVSPFTTVERKDVGLTLRVRPTINENGTVKMTIFQEISSVAPGTTTDPNGPTTNKRSLESNVLVEDGGLVMLGGLLSDTYGTSTEKVPLAGDIPLVGNLFRSENRSRVKNNLMMFLRPIVMRDANTSEAFAYDRYDEIRGLQQQSQPNSSNVVFGSVDAAPILPTTPKKSLARDANTGLRRLGAQLIPSAAPSKDLDSLRTDAMKGALPPTSDPGSARELP